MEKEKKEKNLTIDYININIINYNKITKQQKFN